jgi:membrane protein DedA with SNARE-associated domain
MTHCVTMRASLHYTIKNYISQELFSQLGQRVILDLSIRRALDATGHAYSLSGTFIALARFMPVMRCVIRHMGGRGRFYSWKRVCTSLSQWNRFTWENNKSGYAKEVL